MFYVDLLYTFHWSVSYSINAVTFFSPVDPSITYKPEVDYNHNHSDRISCSTTNSPFEHTGGHIINGCEPPEGSRVTVEEVISSRIPLTVTSADDDEEIDSGTESIDSKDSDGSLRLSVEDENGSNNKDKSDRKRPGRKKGQGRCPDEHV